MKVVLVAEAWGRHEAQFSHALVGPSGRELTLQIGISGLAPYMQVLCRKCKRQTRFLQAHCEHCSEHIWPNEFDLIAHWKLLREQHGIAVTNVFNMRPFVDPLIPSNSSNDLGHLFGDTSATPMPSWKASKKTGGSHLKPEHFHHVERLWRELGEMNPNLVIALGNCSCWALLGQTKISALRGTVSRTDTRLTGLDLKTLPTYHPAAILHQPVMRPATIADMTKAAREAKFPEIRRPERWILIADPDSHGLADGYSWFDRPATAYAVDIETYRGQITMVGFARSPSDALVVMLRNEGQNYWPTSDLEFQAWKLIQFGLGTPQAKIFQNGVYDLSYFLRMGLGVKNAAHDTMLWHHSEYPELPKSLGFLGSLYANEVSWKLMVRHNTLKRDE